LGKKTFRQYSDSQKCSVWSSQSRFCTWWFVTRYC